MTASITPEVSVCIPVFNAAPWIERAVRSGLDQTGPEVEVVVVDNASTDGTPDRVQQIGDPRIRLYRNSHNMGVCRNWNRAASLARGRYIKLLCADDVIYPDCVEAMLAVFEQDPAVGMVFSPRDVDIEDPSDEATASWARRHAASHQRFGGLDTVNDGHVLLDTWVKDQLASNWIGEPSNVMLSRECLSRVGLFNLHMRQKPDMDLWVRVMLHHRVGFVDRPLARFLLRKGSVSSINRAAGGEWLDRLWFLDGLLTYEEARRRYPELRWLRRKAYLRLIRQAVEGSRAPAEGKAAAIRSYLAGRVRGRREREDFYGSIDDHGPPGETVELRLDAVPD